MPQQLRVTRELNATGAALIGVGAGQNHLMGGKTFFVSCNTGSDGNEGTNPSYPLATLERAESLCTTAKHDFIFVQDFWTLTTESPIVFDKTDMHVIGLGSGILFDNGNDIGALSSSGIAVALTGCTDLELAGFNIGGDSSADAISVIGTTFRVHLHHCTMGNNYACLDGIGEGAAGNMTKWEVHHCLFGGHGLLAGDGINCSCLSSYIHDNIFRNPGVRGIDHGSDWTSYWNNMFFSPLADALDPGWGINLDANTSQNLIWNNHAAVVADQSSGATNAENPYRDLTTGNIDTCLNGWSDNWDGQATVTPAVT